MQKSRGPDAVALATGRRAVAVTGLPQPPPRALSKVAEAVVILNLSRSQIYELIRTGRLRTVTEGRSRLFPASAIEDYVELLLGEAR